MQVKSEVMLPRQEVTPLRQRGVVAICQVRLLRDEIALQPREPTVTNRDHLRVD